MSKQVELLEIDKFIISRLWYTVSVILSKEIESHSLANYSQEDIEYLRSLIKSTADEDQKDRWISHKLLLSLEKKNSGKVQQELESVQFATALQLIDDQIPELVEQELKELFEAFSNAKHNLTVNTIKISESTLTFLKENLQKNPTLICWLINELLYVCPTSFANSDEILQDLYSSALKSIIEKAITYDNDSMDGEFSVSDLHKKKAFLDEKSLGTLLCILSKLDLTETKENELLSWLYPALLRVCDTDDVELALYSRKNVKFLKEWHTFLDKAFFRLESPSSLENALKISDAIFSFEDDSVSIDVKELSMRVMRKGTHWMSDILDLCYTLQANGDYERVSKLLSCPPLKILWPSLLLQFLSVFPHIPIITSIETWKKNANICRSLNFLLEKCSLISNNPSIQKYTSIMKRHLKVIHWILECKKKTINTASYSSALEKTLSVRKILSCLQTSCILLVLKSSVDLHEEEYNEVLDLLKDSPESSNIFHSYRAMLSALKAILACENFNSRHKEVEKYFLEMESLLNSLFPLHLRLKVIENIFSFLFLQHEDFCDADRNSEEDDHEKEKATSALENKELIQKRFGFIANKYTIREVLHRLKNCVLTAEIDSVKQKKESGISNDLDQINKSLVNINKAILDAFWRLEFLTSADFVKNAGTVESEKGSYEFNQNEKLKFSSRLKNKSIFYKEENSSSDENFGKSDPDICSEAGSLDNVLSSRRRKRRIIKNMANTESAGNKDFSSRFIINIMLMSKESWVLQCLWKGDHLKAQQIIEMFEMQGTPLDGEVQFSKAIRLFRQELNNHLSPVDVVDSPVSDSATAILQKIRQAAQEGFHSSRITSLLETFLATQEANTRPLKSKTFGSREILTLTVLDLALTIGQTRQTSVSLCDLASKHLKSCKKLEKSSSQEFFSRIHQLLYESNVESSLMEIFCDARIPLNAKQWKEENDFWTDLAEKLRSFKLSQIVTENLDNKINSNGTLGQTSFKEIIDLSGKGYNYLEMVYSHLQILQTIINDNSTVITESDILKNPLDSYFGHQIFDLNIEPSELEYIANKLQVNLVYSILVNCCPKLACDNGTNSQEICNSQWGYLILNYNSDETRNPEVLACDPNLYVSEILTDLLRTLGQLSPAISILSSKDLESLSKNPKIQSILKRTSILSSLDLSELLVGHHTLAFFLNLWNLLFLHSLLYFWAKDPSFNNLRHEVSLIIIGYEVGDLGLVTLSTLRSKLLGTLAWDFKFLGQMESINELAWQDLDLMLDSRAIFAMANEFVETPVIKVFNPQTLNEDLNSAMLDYLNYYKPKTDLNDSKLEIKLPELIQRYLNFIKSNPQENEINSLSSTLKYFESLDEMNYKSLAFKYDLKLKYTSDEKQEEEKKEENSSLEIPDWKSRIIKPSLLRYLEGHCWLLSYLVQRIHEESPTILETDCENTQRTACLENLLNSSWTKILSALFNDNRVTASIQENIPLNTLWSFFEESLRKENYHESLDIINAMPDNFLAKNVELQCFKDKVLSLLSSKKDEQILNYIYQIKDINILVQTILLNMQKWSMAICEEALLHALHHHESENLPAHCKIKMNETLCRVMIFRKILPYCESEISLKDATWFDVVNCTEKTDPGRVIQSLIKENKFELCFEWLEYQSFSSEMHTLVTQDLFLGLLKNEEEDFKHAKKLLQALPLNQSITMCKEVLKRLEKISAMKFVVKFLLEHCKATKTLKYKKALIGIAILDELDDKEKVLYIHLICEPLLMLEQLLMNCKFKTLQKTLNAIEGKLQEANISIESFDKMIRFYASKSLDFRVAVQRDGVDSKTRDSQFLESDGQAGNEFVMPVNVPTKEEWIPNDKAKVCSSCKEVIFSMFNRRHHCRRCGRVVCAMCSQHRMRVAGYPNSVPVRVCKYCKLQTTLQQMGAPSVPSSEILESWKLTTEDSYNQTVRDEFSFEYAPNISLCLAILNLHSDHKAYATFLLDQCDEMKKLLQPLSGGKVNLEIDHALIIKMIRSLLVAAKVKCAKLGLNAGLTHCDRFLSQVDLITILVQSDCLSLIPTDDLDDYAFRKLRDLLTEKEQWTLALDVSTKSGLETQGVWAAWGKACLKVGYFDRAREKFSHCLDKVLYENFDDWVILSHPESLDSTEDSESQNFKVELTSPRKHEVVKSRPLKDPPLLTEILQILENLNLNGQGFKSSANTAQEILNTLNSLKAISQGNYPIQSVWNENVYYQESLYYLLMYGSCSSILEFFVKQRDFDKCLNFVMENDVEQDLFFNTVYLRCLRNESVENLLNAMRNKDPSLLIWKKYLVYICRNLEKRSLLNTLYHLQLYMKDYIRAAMTCIRFYKNEASTYTDLCQKTHWLLEAQGHLEAELKMDNFGNKKRRKSVGSQSGSGGLTMEMEPPEIDKHVNTISRQMEIAKFLGSAEKEGRTIGPFLGYLSNMDAEGSQTEELPTLFGNHQQKTQLAVLAILCGRDVEEGFGIAFRIMQDYNLRPQKVYSLVGHVLALKKKINSIEQLIKCCRSSGAPDSSAISDRILAHCVKLLLSHSCAEAGPNPKDQVNSLIRLITDVELKISSYIEGKQLKAAYLLAVKHSRSQDIRRILKEADRLGQNAIKSICTKWLQQTQGS